MSDLPRDPLSTRSETLPPPVFGSDHPSPTEEPKLQPRSAEPPSSGSTVDTAKQEAQQVAHTAVGSGKEVAATAKDVAKNVAAETKQQAASLLDTVRSEVGQQAVSSQGRFAEALHGWSKELGAMASSSQESGPLTDLAHQASRRGGEIAHWLQDREPSDVLEEVRSFARQRPGTFLVLCGLAGVVAGRLTRSTVASRTSLDDKDEGYRQDRPRTDRPDATSPVSTPAVDRQTSVSTGVYGGTVESTEPTADTYGADRIMPEVGYAGTTRRLDDPNGGPIR